MFLLQFNMPDRLPRGGRPRLQVRPPRNPDGNHIGPVHSGPEYASILVCHNSHSIVRRRHSVRNGMLKSNKDT